MTKRYNGAENANHDRVTRYLTSNYEMPLTGRKITPTMAYYIIQPHRSVLITGQDSMSFAYYVGDEIAKLAGLMEIEEDE